MRGGLKSFLSGATRLPRRLAAQAGDILRVSEFLLLRPVASYFPASWAYGFADAAGALIAFSPLGARARRSMRAAFPARDPAKLAREWLSRPFRDYVFAVRVSEGRDDPNTWNVESRNLPAILSEPGRSVIVATGHMSRQAMTAAFMQRFNPKNMIAVVAELEHERHDARDLRIKLQLGEMMRGITRLRSGAVEFVKVGGAQNVAKRLLVFLKRSESVVVVATDAPWPRSAGGGHERPFAGFATQNFALGTARLSRMSQCPIVMCVPFLDSENRIVVEWSDPIPPPAPDAADADIRTTNLMLDTFEAAIARHPGQYVLAIGHDRAWDEQMQRWGAAAEAPAPETAQREAARASA